MRVMQNFFTRRYWWSECRVRRVVNAINAVRFNWSGPWSCRCNGNFSRSTFENLWPIWSRRHRISTSRRFLFLEIGRSGIVHPIFLIRRRPVNDAGDVFRRRIELGVVARFEAGARRQFIFSISCLLIKNITIYNGAIIKSYMILKKSEIKLFWRKVNSAFPNLGYVRNIKGYARNFSVICDIQI